MSDIPWGARVFWPDLWLTLGDRGQRHPALCLRDRGPCGVCPSGTHILQPDEEPWAPNLARPTGPAAPESGVRGGAESKVPGALGGENQEG